MFRHVSKHQLARCPGGIVEDLPLVADVKIQDGGMQYVLPFFQVPIDKDEAPPTWLQTASDDGCIETQPVLHGVQVEIEEKVWNVGTLSVHREDPVLDHAVVARSADEKRFRIGCLCDGREVSQIFPNIVLQRLDTGCCWFVITGSLTLSR